MKVYRITQEKYADDLSGNGARLFGGRWNSEGLFAVYVSSSRALALLEILAHTPAKMLNEKIYMLISLVIPGNIVAGKIEREKLIMGWNAPDTRPITKKLGDNFLKAKNGLMLAVPSVIISEEINYLINPMHADIKKIKQVSKRRITFDSRFEENL